MQTLRAMQHTRPAPRLPTALLGLPNLVRLCRRANPDLTLIRQTVLEYLGPQALEYGHRLLRTLTRLQRTGRTPAPTYLEGAIYVAYTLTMLPLYRGLMLQWSPRTWGSLMQTASEPILSACCGSLTWDEALLLENVYRTHPRLLVLTMINLSAQTVPDDHRELWTEMVRHYSGYPRLWRELTLRGVATTPSTEISTFSPEELTRVHSEVLDLPEEEMASLGFHVSRRLYTECIIRRLWDLADRYLVYLPGRDHWRPTTDGVRAVLGDVTVWERLSRDGSGEMYLEMIGVLLEADWEGTVPRLTLQCELNAAVGYAVVHGEGERLIRWLETVPQGQRDSLVYGALVASATLPELHQRLADNYPDHPPYPDQPVEYSGPAEYESELDSLGAIVVTVYLLRTHAGVVERGTLPEALQSLRELVVHWSVETLQSSVARLSRLQIWEGYWSPEVWEVLRPHVVWDLNQYWDDPLQMEEVSVDLLVHLEEQGRRDHPRWGWLKVERGCLIQRPRDEVYRSMMPSLQSGPYQLTVLLAEEDLDHGESAADRLAELAARWR